MNEYSKIERGKMHRCVSQRYLCPQGNRRWDVTVTATVTQSHQTFITACSIRIVRWLGGMGSPNAGCYMSREKDFLFLFAFFNSFFF